MTGRQKIREVALDAYWIRGDICAAFDAAIDATVADAAEVVEAMFPGGDLTKLKAMFRERMVARLDEKEGDNRAPGISG